MLAKKVIIALGAVALLSLLTLRFDALRTFSASISQVADAPVGYDPLTALETEKVIAAAQTNTVGAASVHQELLLVERHDGGKNKSNPPRQGDLYLYDYATDTLIHSTVDIASGTVTAVEHLQGVQLPLNRNEDQRALDLIQADQALWTSLTQRHQQIAGKPLTQIDQLQVKITVFHADSLPDRLNKAAQQCGQHRCAQVLLFTVDKTLLEIMPIVDLSLGQVVQVLN